MRCRVLVRFAGLDEAQFDVPNLASVRERLAGQFTSHAQRVIRETLAGFAAQSRIIESQLNGSNVTYFDSG